VTGNRRLNAVLLGGFACGVLDITAAFIVYGFFGTRPIVLLQFIASGALGMRSFDGGLATAALGLFFEFLIAFTAAAAYVVAGSRLPRIVQRPAIAGPLYGVAVYVFMNQVVVAHSATPKGAFSLKLTIAGLLIHIFCVGLPIALAAGRYADKELART
jgi:hypothetical protein